MRPASWRFDVIIPHPRRAGSLGPLRLLLPTLCCRQCLPADCAAALGQSSSSAVWRHLPCLWQPDSNHSNRLGRCANACCRLDCTPGTFLWHCCWIMSNAWASCHLLVKLLRAASSWLSKRKHSPSSRLRQQRPQARRHCQHGQRRRCCLLRSPLHWATAPAAVLTLTSLLPSSSGSQAVPLCPQAVAQLHQPLIFGCKLSEGGLRLRELLTQPLHIRAQHASCITIGHIC